MTILEATARAFGPQFRGGGERYPTVLARGLSEREDVLFSYCSQGMTDPPEGVNGVPLPGRSLSVPPVLGPLNPLPTFATVRGMRQCLLDHARDLEFLHVHNLRTAFSASWLTVAHMVRSSGRFRVLLTDHGARFAPFPRALLRSVDAYIAVSAYSLAMLQAWAPRPGVVVAPPVADGLMEKAVVRTFDQRPIDLLYLGRLVPWKRPDLIVPLAEVLERRFGQPVRVVIGGATGPANELAALRAQFRGTRLAIPPELHENPSEEEIARLYGSAKLLLFLSTRTDRSGRSYPYPELAALTATEAAAFGTPAIVSNLPGVREQVTDEVTGLVVDPTQLGDAAERIGDLLNDPARWARFSAKARSFVERERTVRAATDRLCAFLATLRGGPN